MADEDVLTVEGIGGAVACGFIVHLVAFDEQRAAAKTHVFSCLVEIWAFNALAATHCHTVVALASPTAVVPRHEEIIVVVVLQDKRCLDGIGAGMCRCGVGLGCSGARGMASGNGAGLFAFGNVHGGVELGQLYSVPERAPHEPWRVGFVYHEVRVDGIPVVAVLA